MPVPSYHSLTCRQLARLLSTHGWQTSVQAADAACADDVRHVFGRHGPLRGVVHMASQPREQLVATESWAGVSSALGAKANGAWLNHAVACRLPSFQLLFSSIYSLGGHHLGAYAAANVLLNALAERGAAHGIAALALNLPPVRAVGIAAAAFGSLLDRGNSSVADLAIETKQLTEHLAELLRPPIAPSYLLLPGERAGAEALLGVVTTNRMLGQALGWPAAPERLTQSMATPGIVRDTAASDTAFDQKVLDTLSAITGKAPTLDTPLRELGIDSMAAMRVAHQLGSLVDSSLRLSVTDIFQQGSPRAVAALLRAAANGDGAPTVSIDIDAIGTQRVRCLVLHGDAADAALMELMLEATGWITGCSPRVEFLCVDAPFVCAPIPHMYRPLADAGRYSRDSYFEWRLGTASAEEAGVIHVEQLLADHAPVHAIAGICAGSTVAALIAARHPELAGWINFCGAPPSHWLSGGLSVIGRVVTVPSLHLLSRSDAVYSWEQLMELPTLCNAVALIVTHGHGHVVPPLHSKGMKVEVQRFLRALKVADEMASGYGIATPPGAAGESPDVPQPLPALEVPVDSMSMLSSSVVANDTGMVGHLNFLVIFSVLCNHHFTKLHGPMPLATQDTDCGGGAFVLLLHAVSANALCMQLAIMLCGARDAVVLNSPGGKDVFMTQRVGKLVLVLLVIHAANAILPGFSSVCGAQCRSDLKLLFTESWFIVVLVLCRLVKCLGNRASNRTFALLSVAIFLLQRTGWMGNYGNRPGKPSRIKLPIGPPVLGPESLFVAYSVAPLLLQANGLPQPWVLRLGQTGDAPAAVLCSMLAQAGFCASLVWLYAADQWTFRNGWGWLEGGCERINGRLQHEKNCCDTFRHDLLAPSPTAGSYVVAQYFHAELGALVITGCFLLASPWIRRAESWRRRQLLVAPILCSIHFFFQPNRLSPVVNPWKRQPLDNLRDTAMHLAWLVSELGLCTAWVMVIPRVGPTVLSRAGMRPAFPYLGHPFTRQWAQWLAGLLTSLGPVWFKSGVLGPTMKTTAILVAVALFWSACVPWAIAAASLVLRCCCNVRQLDAPSLKDQVAEQLSTCISWFLPKPSQKEPHLRERHLPLCWGVLGLVLVASAASRMTSSLSLDLVAIGRSIRVLQQSLRLPPSAGSAVNTTGLQYGRLREMASNCNQAWTASSRMEWKRENEKEKRVGRTGQVKSRRGKKEVQPDGKVAGVPKQDKDRPAPPLHHLEATSSRGKLLEREAGRPKTINSDGASRRSVSNKTSTKRGRRRGPG